MAEATEKKSKKQGWRKPKAASRPTQKVKNESQSTARTAEVKAKKESDLEQLTFDID